MQRGRCRGIFELLASATHWAHYLQFLVIHVNYLEFGTAWIYSHLLGFQTPNSILC